VDSNSLETLIKTHQADIYRYLKYLGATSAVAEDMVQETFIGAYQNSNPPPLDDAKQAGAWLRAISRNQFFKYCSRVKTSPVVINSELLEQAESHWAATIGNDRQLEYYDALERCMEKLDDRGRKLIDMRYHRKMSREDMATASSLTPDGIKSALRKIRNVLSDCIRKQVKHD